MADLTIHDLPEDLMEALRRQASSNGRGVEDELQAILRAALAGGSASFAVRAASLRKRLASDVDSAEVIRRDRDSRTLAEQAGA